MYIFTVSCVIQYVTYMRCTILYSNSNYILSKFISLRITANALGRLEHYSFGATLRILSSSTSAALRHTVVSEHGCLFKCGVSLLDSKRFCLLFTVSLASYKGFDPTVQLPTNCLQPCELLALLILRRVRTIKPFILSYYPGASLLFLVSNTGIEPATE